MPRPVVIIHGYSDRGESFQTWKDILVNQMGYAPTDVHVCSYRSLTNEISINDIAEGFDRALKLQTSLASGEPFDAIVHSTGMLVIRSWLTHYGAERSPLRNLIALAPATFGSPLAHKGRSFLGAVFKGSKNLFSPDFLEAGDEVLHGLELASGFTWDLAHRDLFAGEPFYGPSRRTPYVFVFCGNRAYSGIRSVVNEDGTDGTVRWAGCALNSRKFRLDLSGSIPNSKRVLSVPFRNVDVDLIPIDGKTHGTIVTDPGDVLIDLVRRALEVNSGPTFDEFMRHARRVTKPARERMDEYQQFVIRAVDERGDPIRDWNLQLFRSDGANKPMREFGMDVHRYSRDPSLRSFHVNLTKLGKVTDDDIRFGLIASTGTDFVSYYGIGSETTQLSAGVHGAGKWDAQMKVRQQIDGETTLFYPFTTTLIEMVLNREPMPLDPSQVNRVTWWL